jgi:type III secretion protein J
MQRRWRKILQPWLLVLLLAGCDSKVILNTGLTENDANDIISELSKYKIEADKQIDKTGVTVLVAQDNIERSVRILNANGLPHKARTNLGEVFQKNGIISSPLEERARYIYALSQELESTLSQIDGVVVARVNVVLPERVAPGEPVQPASASVFIKYTPDMDPDSIEPRIRRLVAASIPGLSGKNDGALSVVFVPAAVYHDRVELVTLGPFQLTLSQYATVRALFFSLIGLLLLLGGIFMLVPKLKAMKRGKNTATTELAVVPSERR